MISSATPNGEVPTENPGKEINDQQPN